MESVKWRGDFVVVDVPRAVFVIKEHLIRFGKRVLDLIVVPAAPVDTLPLWPIIPLAVRLDSRLPAFFDQERGTKDRRIFRIHMFRTMRNPGRAFDTTAPLFKLESDTRLSRVGAFLCRLTLDELSQLWNAITRGISIGPIKMQWLCDPVPG